MIVRQLSNKVGEELQCFCRDSTRPLGSLVAGERRVDDLRLGCGCVLHYDCFINYIRYKMGDRLGMDLRGFACPYGSDCKFWAEPSNYIDEASMMGASVNTDTSATLFSASTASDDLGPPLAFAGGGQPHSPRNKLQRQWTLASRVYFITTQDMEEMRVYGEKHAEALAGLECKPLGQQELDNFCAWLDESRGNIGPAHVPETTDPYVLATSKACPICGFRSTHYHRHHCHHISRNEGQRKHQGCPNCAHQYCYKCLSPDTDNERERGSKHPVAARGKLDELLLPTRQPRRH